MLMFYPKETTTTNTAREETPTRVDAEEAYTVGGVGYL